MRMPNNYNIYMQSNQALAHSVYIYICVCVCVQLRQIMINILITQPISNTALMKVAIKEH